MSLERLVVFQSPNFYIRCLTIDKIKVITCSIWFFASLLYVYVRFGVCFMTNKNASLQDVIGKCNQETFLLYFVTIAFVILSSYTCYWRIIRIIKFDHVSHTMSVKSMQEYRSTSLVFVYIVTITLTSLGYVVILTLNLDRDNLRIGNDMINTFNGMTDPCVYLLWYKECRMEIFKLLPWVPNVWKEKLEEMRMKIFEVVTMETTDNCPQRRRSTDT